MAMTQTKLHAPAQLGTSPSTLYTVPASTTTIVKQIALCNTATATRTVAVYLVPSGGSASTTNAILYDVSMNAKSTTFVGLSAVMATSYFIQASASVASSVSIHSFGIQEA